MGEYVLAMYDVRGKQDYIFRSSHLKEIMGGSEVIADCFSDYLYPQAVTYRNECVAGMMTGEEAAIFNYQEENFPEEERRFSLARFRERMAGPQYLGEVIYDGGGNFFVLYRDRETCTGINRRFTRKLLEETGTLRVLCTYKEVTLEDFRADQAELYRMHRVTEARENVSLPVQVLPFTQVDLLTSMPLCDMVRLPEGESRVSRESACKYRKYEEHRKQEGGQDATILDDLVEEKGRDSHLAVIYIDGNNIGAMVQDRLKNKPKDYEICINALRECSEEIQENFITRRREAIDRYFEEKYGAAERAKHSRFIVKAGDEVNFICKASDAYEVVRAYFEDMPAGYSACAGVAIFHSHAPYSEAYRIAEECCESGKQRMKKFGLSNVCLMDVQYCQGGIGNTLESIRERETGALISKPWYIVETQEIRDRDPQCVTLDRIDELAGELGALGHSNVKTLAEAAKSGLQKLKLELERIRAHRTGPEDDVRTLWSILDPDVSRERQEQLRAMIYDVVILYDLWFRREDSEIGGDRA